MLNAIAIDDEPLSLKIISRFCEEAEGISLKKTFSNQTEALKYIRNYPVDLIFLDIRMPQKDGINFYKTLDNKVSVIFTTAYSEHAVEGFNLDAVDYLLKPFSLDRLKEAVKKAVQKQEYLTNSEKKKYLFIRADYELHKIDFDQILFIQALDDYIRIFLDNGQKITARMSMKEILEKVPKKEFIRIHRSYIISVKHISTILQKNIHIQEFVLPIGETFRQNLREFI